MSDTTGDPPEDDEPRRIAPFEVGEDPRVRRRVIAGTAGTALVGSVIFVTGAAGALALFILAVCAS